MCFCFFLESNDLKRPFTFEDYFNDTIRWQSHNLYWISGTNQPTSERLIEFATGLLNLAISSFPCADKDYLHKDSNGNVILHNAETREESLYLSNSTFVIIQLFMSFMCLNESHIGTR